MIWQENVKNIIMLANVLEGGKVYFFNSIKRSILMNLMNFQKKTEKYWPDVNEQLEFGIYVIKFLSSQIFADFEYRVLLVSNRYEERKVTFANLIRCPMTSTVVLIPDRTASFHFLARSRSPALFSKFSAVPQKNTHDSTGNFPNFSSLQVFIK